MTKADCKQGIVYSYTSVVQAAICFNSKHDQVNLIYGYRIL